MSVPAPKAPCSSPCTTALEPAELISDGTCRPCVRYSRAILALLLVNLLVTVVFGVLGVRDGSSTKPDPKPSPTATATPSPSTPTPSGGSMPTPMPTPTMPPDPTARSCNIFDPECDSGATGGISSGTEA
ncbi:hypothetical protein ABZT04_33345 [Streptomyces sp. NPDC005492]|uniref:hypothetical protein n=1 Tax=Streptomyces sp. NPDC005492 TaxID=3156883 RepID=UPI0033B4F385